MELAKNATTEPKLAFKALEKCGSCINSTTNTAINGIIIIPNGGKTKQPTITPINAAYSLNFDPPNLLTKYLFIMKSAIMINIVNNAIDT